MSYCITWCGHDILIGLGHSLLKDNKSLRYIRVLLHFKLLETVAPLYPLVHVKLSYKQKLRSKVLKRIIRTERPLLVHEFIANFCG
jgi:hypothetical protein